MITAGMGKVLEMLAPSSVHKLTPKPPKHTDGLAKEVYEQMREEFMIAGPFVLHGDIPELLAAAWCVVRETLLCGDASRGNKEIIAWAISESNECPFCIGAHRAAVRETGAKEQSIEQWARFSFSAEATAVKFTHQEHIAEFIGTLTAFHYLNRMVSVFLDEKMMPMPKVMDPVTDSMAKAMMVGVINKGGKKPAGESLKFLPNPDPAHAWKPEWAEDNQIITKAIAAWSSTIETVALDHMRPKLLDFLRSETQTWQGGRINRSDIPDKNIPSYLSRSDREAAKLALLIIMAPHAVEDADVDVALNTGWSQENILALTAWSALQAAKRCATWTAARS